MKYIFSFLFFTISIGGFSQTVHIRFMKENHYIDSWISISELTKEEIYNYAAMRDTVMVHDTVYLPVEKYDSLMFAREKKIELKTDTIKLEPLKIASLPTPKDTPQLTFNKIIPDDKKDTLGVFAISGNMYFDTIATTGSLLYVDNVRTVSKVKKHRSKKIKKVIHKISAPIVKREKKHLDKPAFDRCQPDTVRGMIIYNNGEIDGFDGNTYAQGYWIGCNAYSNAVYANNFMWFPDKYKRTELYQKTDYDIGQHIVKHDYGAFYTLDYKPLSHFRVYGMIADSIKFAGEMNVLGMKKIIFENNLMTIK